MDHSNFIEGLWVQIKYCKDKPSTTECDSYEDFLYEAPFRSDLAATLFTAKLEPLWEDSWCSMSYAGMK